MPTDPDRHLQDVLWEETAYAVGKKTWLRVVLVGLWVGWAGGVGVLLGNDIPARAFPWALTHWILAWIIAVAYARSRDQIVACKWVGWSAVLVDAPLLFLAIRASSIAEGGTGLSALFLLGLYAILIIGTASTVWVRVTLTLWLLTTALLTVLILESNLHWAWAGAGAVVTTAAVLLAREQGYRVHRVSTRWANEQTQRSRLGRYFSPSVVERILGSGEEKIAPEHHEITILFADLRDFTPTAERLDGEEVVELLNRYLGVMVSVLFEHRGILDKMMGDGILAYFGGPMGSTDHAGDAVRCAVAMQDALSEVNRVGAAVQAPWLRVGIGIHTGRALLGDVGPPERKDHTVIGDAVNLASRIEQLTKEYEVPILTSEATRRLAGDGFAWRKIGSVPIRGKTGNVTLFALDAEEEKTRELEEPARSVS